jgi:UDP-GlcNAc:undecaprenyl-phosphate GlcNAc-1-phosphate transferase
MRLAKYLAIRANIFIDLPNQRSSHSKPIPRCGGIVVILIFMVSMFMFSGWNSLFVLPYLLGGLLIFIVGIMDDLVNLKGRPKIAGMVLSSMMPILFGLKLEYLGIVLNNQPALYLLSFVWIYGFINAFNFMDGIDGLIGGSAAIGAFFIIVIAVLTGNLFVAGAAMLLLAVCLGFLAFNFSPASIFLGDAGSMFLGYNFAVLGIMLTNGSVNSVPIYVSALIFAPIIYDSMVTFVRRGLEGKNVIEAHREHLYQRLIILGMSHRKVGIIYYLLSVIMGISAIIFLFLPNTITKLCLVILTIIILIGFSTFVYKLEKRHV